MITITVAPVKAPVDPARTLAALRARRSRAENLGKMDDVADFGSKIKALLEDHPELAKTKPPAPSRTKRAPKVKEDADPRRRLGAMRAIRSRHVGKDADKAAEMDRRIAEFIQANPGVDAAKPATARAKRITLDVGARTPEPRSIVTPCIHMNGTSREALADQHQSAIRALSLALAALREAAPNARDYYVQGDDAYHHARTEHQSRIDRLLSVHAELMALWEDIAA